MVYFDVQNTLELSNVGLGQLPFDTFADDQPTDHFALTRYNDRNRSGPGVKLGHLSTFIMPYFGPKQYFHIVSCNFGSFQRRLMLPIEPRGVKVT